MRLPRIAALVAFVVLGMVGVVAFALLNGPTPAQAAAAALEKSAGEVRSDYLADVGSSRPLVLTLELFRKGGYQTLEGGSVSVYPDRVISTTVLTPDSQGRVVKVTEEIAAADGTSPTRTALYEGAGSVGPVGNATGDGTSGSPPSNPFPDSDAPPGPTGHTGVESQFTIAGWLDAQLAIPLSAEDEGFKYVGRFVLNGKPSIRYERRSTLSALPNGQVFDPPVVSLLVLEFVEANPLLARESRYTVLGSGEQILEFQTTSTSVGYRNAKAA